MKRLVLLALVVLLTACVPALVPTLERLNGNVLITLQPARNVYDVQVIVLDAVSEDIRCAQFESDLVCALGDLRAREKVLIGVVGEVGRVSCVAYGYLREDLRVSSYRPFACAVR